ncbi:MAG: phosphodiester glycosidase family protein [Erythrobacter sp.]
MRQAVWLIGAAALALGGALAGCSEQPAGEPAMRARLDGQPIETAAPAPELAPVAEPEPALADAPSACRDVVFEDISLTHCIADPAAHRITMANAPAGGLPFGSIAAYAETADAGRIAFAMNGGAFGDDLKALGYYVENGERLREFNRGDAPEGNTSNFFMKPNGVFFGTGSKWRVLSTEAFYAAISDRPQFGTQSGPMLVIEGKLHPDIQDNGPSRAIRNGVGVDGAGIAHFVIANAPLSFGQLARYFRDELKTPNALYLDGQVSALWDPARGRLDKARSGPIIVVTKAAQTGQ